MALDNIKAIQLGGGITKVIGDLTHTVGAAEESFTAAGGTVVGGQVLQNTASGVVDVTGNTPMSWSLSGGILTITLHGVAAITSGRFWVDILSG